jgi:hypothetical protein
MGRTGADSIRRLIFRCLFAAVALSLLSMPVTYRGGAEKPHPHFFFQVWIDAANNDFDHHRHHAHDHQETATSESRHAHPTQPATVDADDGDAPSLSALMAPQVRSLSLVIGVWLALILGVAGTPAPNDRSKLTGRSLRPEFPPPRFLGSLA